MIDPKLFFDSLTELGIEFYTGVPDSLLRSFCSYVTDNVDASSHIIAANEGCALSIGAGQYLATGNVPLIYMQNSGIGNAINPLLSTLDKEVFSIPSILLIGWRGEPGVKDEPQHKKQGRVTLDLLDAMEIPYIVFDSTTCDNEAISAAKKTIVESKTTGKPCALVISKGTFLDYTLKKQIRLDRPLNREQAIKLVIDLLQPEDVIVSTTGVASRELFELRETKVQGHERDLLSVGGMGHASQIALGIAFKKTSRQVFCFDGDGAFIMHMGGVAIIANSNCKNFKHVVFNNAAHDSVGAQPTVGDKVNIVSTAISLGYSWAKTASTQEEIIVCVNELRNTSGPALLEIQVKSGFRNNLGRPTVSPKNNKKLFMEFLKD